VSISQRGDLRVCCWPTPAWSHTCALLCRRLMLLCKGGAQGTMLTQQLLFSQRSRHADRQAVAAVPAIVTHFAAAWRSSVVRIREGSVRSCCHRCCFSTGSSTGTPSSGRRASSSCQSVGREQPVRVRAWVGVAVVVAAAQSVHVPVSALCVRLAAVDRARVMCAPCQAGSS
jgi:hypothetical protein